MNKRQSRGKTEQKKQNGVEEISEVLIAKNFLELMIDIKLQAHEPQETPKRIHKQIISILCLNC